MKKILFFTILYLFINTSFSQNVTISGYVSNAQTSEKLIGAAIFADNNVVTTNEFGFFSISVDTIKTKTLKVKFLGYYEKTVPLNNYNKQINIQLQSSTNIGTVYVYANRRNIDYYTFSTDEIKKLPSLTGEKDVMKSLQLMPGIQFGNEGTSDLYVRGGTPDQNLILLDDVPMHFVSHLGSFVSIFDVNAINSIKLIKNGFPAKYGSNLSSVLDIRLKDGNMNKLEGDFTIGLISSKISLNGPIIKNKISFVFTLRRSNFDPISWAFYKLAPENETFVNYKFYDLNAKLNYTISDKDKIDISFYSGSDYNIMKTFNTDESIILAQYDTRFKENYTNSWGNYINSARWTHIYSSKLFQKLILGYTSYHYMKNESFKAIDKNTGNVVGFGNSNYYTKIQDFVIKLDYDYYINTRNHLNFGLSSIYHTYNPGEFTSIYWEKNLDTLKANKNEGVLKPLDADTYIEYSYNSTIIDFNIGIHGNLYILNKNKWYNYQPRIKIQYKPNSYNHILFAYDRTYQNLHILTMSSSIVPADIWVPATKIAQPEKANQFSVGYSHNFNKKYEVSVSGFYKTINNLIDYKRYFYVTDTVNNPTWEQQIVTNGTGKIYGLEFLAEKKSGKFTGWISYTYMKNYRQFEDLNDGEPYPFNYDRRHNLKVVAQFSFNKNLSLNAIFMFGSGYPISLPVIKQNIVEVIEGEDGNVADWRLIVPENTYYYSQLNFDEVTYIFNKINSYRMPAYHRLDISLNWSKEKKRGNRTWTFGIYNVYNHQNAYFLFLDYDTPKQHYEWNKKYPIALYKFTLFPIIPSISYTFKFK